MREIEPLLLLVADKQAAPAVHRSYVIYRHVNRVNGKCYVGQTKNTMEKRWSQHVNAAIDGHRGGCAYLSAAIRKHGADAFEHFVLERCESREAANIAEANWIAHYQSTTRELGYNLTSGGGVGSKFNDAVIAKRRISSKRTMDRLGPEGRASIARKRAETMGREGFLRCAATRAANISKERLREIAAKSTATKGPEGCSECARRSHVSRRANSEKMDEARRERLVRVNFLQSFRKLKHENAVKAAKTLRERRASGRAKEA